MDTTDDLTSKPEPHRGSRKHILDWVRSPAFLVDLNSILAPSGTRVGHDAKIMPTGQGDLGDEEARLERFLPDEAMQEELQRWWLVARRGANTPNWDLAALGTHGSRKALVLIEAKANTLELSESGKSPAGSSENSLRNHEQIGAAINEANVGLNQVMPGFSVSRDSHYQLSNRWAFAWKLASLGVPTVLVYLGFVNDRGIDIERPMLRDDTHWRTLFWEHAVTVMPRAAENQWLTIGSAGIYFCLTSRPCLENSSPPLIR